MQERDKQVCLDERRERLADTLRRLAARETKLARHYRDSAHEHKGRARRILKKIESLQVRARVRQYAFAYVVICLSECACAAAAAGWRAGRGGPRRIAFRVG